MAKPASEAESAVEGTNTPLMLSLSKHVRPGGGKALRQAQGEGIKLKVRACA